MCKNRIDRYICAMLCSIALEKFVHTIHLQKTLQKFGSSLIRQLVVLIDAMHMTCQCMWRLYIKKRGDMNLVF